MSLTKESKNGATPPKKLFKYSKTELVFRIQIYSVLKNKYFDDLIIKYIYLDAQQKGSLC